MEHIMNGKPIFEAVRALLGRSFTDAELIALERAIDCARDSGTVSTDAGAPRLGHLSERFECGGAGPGAISSHSTSRDGIRYGIWQFSSRSGGAAAFVAAEGSAWAADFGDHTPGSLGFTTTWMALAARDPEAFGDAQHAFIERTRHRPVVAAVLEKTGLNLDARHAALCEATWSTAVQHGAATKILVAAVARADARVARQDPGFDRTLVQAIYAERCRHMLNLAGRVPGEAERRRLVAVTMHRYPVELSAALAMLSGADAAD